MASQPNYPDATAVPASPAPPPRVLIAGIGNIFLGDDAFGVEVAQRLMRRSWPDAVRVADFGIRGIDLTYALMDGCEVAILIDAAPRGFAPGTVYTIEPEPEPGSSGIDSPIGLPLIEAHSLDPNRVLRLVAAMGGRVGRIILVGCEPTPIDPEQDIQTELSPPVRAAVAQAAALVERLASQVLQEPPAIAASPAHAAGDANKELQHVTFP